MRTTRTIRRRLGSSYQAEVVICGPDGDEVGRLIELMDRVLKIEARSLPQPELGAAAERQPCGCSGS